MFTRQIRTILHNPTMSLRCCGGCALLGLSNHGTSSPSGASGPSLEWGGPFAYIGWMADNVVSFPVPQKVSDKTLETIPDTDHNRNGREDQGPPVGTQAYMCDCGCFAFYFSPSNTHCYECHEVHEF